MNKEQTLEAIKVMQAYVDGEEVECRHPNNTEWKKAASPSWDFDGMFYRIKPKPVEFNMWYRDENNWAFGDAYCNQNYYKQQGYRLITVREVV